MITAINIMSRLRPGGDVTRQKLAAAAGRSGSGRRGTPTSFWNEKLRNWTTD